MIKFQTLAQDQRRSTWQDATFWRAVVVTMGAVGLSACASLGASGPSTGAMKRGHGANYADSQISIIDLDENAVRRVAAYSVSSSFAEVFGDVPATETVIGNGDIVDVVIWEAPPAVLFGATVVDARLSPNPLAQSGAIPQQMVSEDGTISVPFAGKISAAGRHPAQVARDIVARLTGKAHDPQAVVRVVQNEARTVTVIGEVASSRRVPLSARGERVLDVIAAVGGPRQPVGKTTVQMARGGTISAMPLDRILREPAQNIRLLSGDIVTVLFQPYSFIALGAVSQNAEVPFEGAGLTLAQALGRIGGLRDDRADTRGVFIFRLEDPVALDPTLATSAPRTIAGRVPVIYRLNLSEAPGFFAAQNFLIRDDDVLYVSNAPGVDLQRFVTTLSSVAFSTIAIGDALK